MLMLAVLAIWVAAFGPALAMRDDHLADLRRQTVDMFYHGFDNYMEHAFPEDEVCFSPL